MMSSFLHISQPKQLIKTLNAEKIYDYSVVLLRYTLKQFTKMYTKTMKQIF